MSHKLGDPAARELALRADVLVIGGGAKYVSVCLPAFSPATVHRDDARA